MKEVKASFPTDHVKVFGLYPEVNRELLLRNGNDIRFEFMKQHFGHKVADQLREWCAVSLGIGRVSGAVFGNPNEK